MAFISCYTADQTVIDGGQESLRVSISGPINPDQQALYPTLEGVGSLHGLAKHGCIADAVVQSLGVAWAILSDVLIWIVARERLTLHGDIAGLANDGSWYTT